MLKLYGASRRRPFSTIKAKNLLIEKTRHPRTMPELDNTVPFGTIFSNHMLEIDWDFQHGWGAPHIKPFQKFYLPPGVSALNYCTTIYEGMKCYSSPDKDLLLFRPHKNMQRMRLSASAVGLPDFDGEEVLKCIEQLILLDRGWVPEKRKFSMYIRPALIGTSSTLRFSVPTKAKLFTVLSSVGPYYPEGFVPVKLYCSQDAVRAWPGGHGNIKTGGNYGPPIVHSERAKALGYDQILWLINGLVTEVGTMNFFVFWINEEGHQELLTSPLDSIILPGVTRSSILALAREWKDFKVTERRFTIDELIAGIKAGRVIELFGAGTACIVSPVSNICYNGVDYRVLPKGKNSGVLTEKIMNTLLDIQHGVIPHRWSRKIIQTPETQRAHL